VCAVERLAQVLFVSFMNVLYPKQTKHMHKHTCMRANRHININTHTHQQILPHLGAASGMGVAWVFACQCLCCV